MAPGIEARALLTAESAGVLSTLSVDVGGYPFGSVVPYCLDRQGRPLILISRIAQHYKNVVADRRASLIVLERGVDDVQVNGRVTCIADVLKVAADEIDGVAERYYRYFPQSMDFHKVHDFEFFRLVPVRFRFIGGFGRIHWIEPDRLLLSNPFDSEDERAMVEHMNADHAQAMRDYCRSANVPVADDASPRLAGVDAEGFHLLVGARIVRFTFDTVVTTPTDVRRELVALARRARMDGDS
jgi:putative heme iron utilization protein